MQDNNNNKIGLIYRRESYSLVYSLQPTAYSLQPTAYSLQLTAYSLQLTAYSLQLTAYSYCLHIKQDSFTFLRAGATNGTQMTESVMAAPPVIPARARPTHPAFLEAEAVEAVLDVLLCKKSGNSCLFECDS